MGKHKYLITVYDRVQIYKYTKILCQIFKKRKYNFFAIRGMELPNNY